MSEHLFWGTGWSFPPKFSNTPIQVELSYGAANINQSIDVILKTQRGERVLQPDFGSELRQYIFSNFDATLKNQIVASIRHTLLNDEPRITVESIDITESDSFNATLHINIVYVINQTNTRHNHVFPFSLLEGTNLTPEQKGSYG